METWPRAGMTASGFAFELPMVERHTREIDGLRWPTPRASEIAASATMENISRIRNPRGNLEEVVFARTLPTPTARDWKDGSAPYYREGELQTDSLGRFFGGAVNPIFVEWLMAFPLAWTVSKHLEMPKSRSKQRSRGES